MRFSLSTNWSARRHTEGEALTDEIVALGFDALELGYHTTEELAAGVRRRVQAGAVTVDSVHAYCPVPIGAPHGYPELYLLASLDEDERAMASILVGRTLAFASSMGARAVVLHAGRIFLSALFGDLGTRKLVEALDGEGSAAGAGFQRILAKSLKRRAARVRKYYDGFCLSLEALLPKFEKAGVALCLENLPSIEAFPDAREMDMLKVRFDTPSLAYWHDLGHGQVREYLGWDRHLDVARALLPVTRGIHIHDALPLMNDHLLPGQGLIDYDAYAFYGARDVIRVFEPAPEVKGDELAASLRFMREAWGGQAESEASGRAASPA
jgi:sugar phosphate isomerase/epimerase